MGLFLGCLALAATGPAVLAQVPDGGASPIDAEVRELVAERWGVGAERVHLSWGAFRAVPPPGASIELVGSGRGGHWVVRIGSATGGTSTIRLRTGYEAVRAVASRRLERGVTLTADDVVMRDTIIWNHPTGDSRLPLVGWVTHRRIEMGEILAGPAVQPPLAVEAGRTVDLVWSRGPIGVRLKGIATESGALGEDVFVRTESGTRLRGTVIARSTVRLSHAGIPGGAS